MLNEDSVEIAAPPQLVWDVFSDVERWSEWTDSVTSLTGLDGPALAVGKRFAIKQPGMQKLVWKVTEIDPGTSWTWVQRSPGVRVTPGTGSSPGRRHTLVRQQLEQRGALAHSSGG